MHRTVVFIALFFAFVDIGRAADCRDITNDRERLRCWDKQSLEISEGEELSILTLFDAFQASGLCGFKLNSDAVNRILTLNGLKASDVYNRPRSQSLQHDIDVTAKKFDDDKAGACADAYSDMGPDGPLGQLLSK